MGNILKTVVEIDPDFLKSMFDRLQRIEEGMVEIRAIKPNEYLTPEEFCKETKMSRWQFDMLKNCHQIKFKKIGRKVYVERSEIDRYFRGEMRLPEK